MREDHDPHQQQEAAVSIQEILPGEGTQASTALQLRAQPLPSKAGNDEGQHVYVVAKGGNYAIPTISSATKTFELNYNEPFKIRLPHIITTEPSSITATLHISVEPLSGQAKGEVPQVRVADRGNLGFQCLSIPFRKLWDADLPIHMIGPPDAFEYDLAKMGDGGPPGMQSVPTEKKCCACISDVCRRENINFKCLASSYGAANILLIAGLCTLVFYGLPATGFAYTRKMVAIAAWSQMSSHLMLLVYKLLSVAEVHEVPKLYEQIHMAGTFLSMVVSSIMFFGVPELPDNSWHMSILCGAIALVALAMLLKL